MMRRYVVLLVLLLVIVFSGFEHDHERRAFHPAAAKV
jgi:hypothetical protein